MPPGHTDPYHELLVLRCRRGDREAFEELVAAWDRRLLYYARRLLDREDAAREVLQEVWVKALKGVPALRDPSGLAAWLYTVTRRTAMDRYRQEYAHAPAPEATEISEPADEAAPAASARLDDAERVHHGLSRLPRGDREVLTLFFLRDLSVAEVAEVLEVPPGTVKSRLSRAKRALREVLEREERRRDTAD